MTIKLYNNQAENNRVDKTSWITNELVMSDVILKDGTSIVRPSLLLKATNITHNYLYIPDFNRYYFIVNVASIRNGLWRVDCRVDVLMSFKDTIKLQKALISRNEYDYDNMIEDDLASFKVQKSVEYSNVTNLSTVTDLDETIDFYYNSSDVSKNRNVIVSVAAPINFNVTAPQVDTLNVPETLPKDSLDDRLPSVKNNKVGSSSSMYYAMTPYELQMLLIPISTFAWKIIASFVVLYITKVVRPSSNDV